MTDEADGQSPETPDEINHHIEQAFSGSIESAREFFELLLESDLLVIDRFSPGLAGGNVSYPTQLFPYLAISFEQKTMLPVFSHPLRLKDWTERELSVKQAKFTALSTIIPDGWWIIINPGSDTEKELSPWEIEKLKLGKGEINEIIAEIFTDDTGITTEVAELADEEFTEIKTELRSYAAADGRIAKITLLKELIRRSSDSFEIYEIEKKDVTERLIICVLVTVKEGFAEIQKSITEDLNNRLHLKLIGDIGYELAIEDSSAMSAKATLFNGVEPIYENPLLKKAAGSPASPSSNSGGTSGSFFGLLKGGIQKFFHK